MTATELIEEIEKLEKNGYDADSSLWDDLKSNRNLIPKITHKLEHLIKNSKDTLLIDIAVWGIFWNRMKINPAILNRVMELTQEFKDDFTLMQRILTGLGIAFSKTNNIELLSDLKQFHENEENLIDHRISACISYIMISTGMNLVQILRETNLSVLSLSEL